jgi:folate-dependent phosphoribosylglycinamide formyltransferase PurN
MENKTIVLLAGQGFSTHAVYHAINAAFPIAQVIMENPVDKKTFLKKRIKKLGFITVAGQVLFQALIVPLLERAARKRKLQIVAETELNGSNIPAQLVTQVPSVNDAQTIALLQQWQPDLVIVNGTRIISKNVLNCVPCRFINTHAGITPQYRGVHGTYWALANHDLPNSGVTVHLVDTGIDTGGILYQAQVIPTAQDNFSTYPLLQLAAGIPLLKQAVAAALNNTITTMSVNGPSKLWHHPTAWQYLRNRLFKKIK